jgi:drug/metabolite transporter (DMT)-like permease
MKDWQEAGKELAIGAVIASFTVVTFRMSLALAILCALRPRYLFEATPREHRVGLILGGVTFVGSALQFLGLVWTTPAGSAFITSLTSVWVPLFAWLCFRIAVSGLTVLGLLFCFEGKLFVIL